VEGRGLAASKVEGTDLGVDRVEVKLRHQHWKRKWRLLSKLVKKLKNLQKNSSTKLLKAHKERISLEQTESGLRNSLDQRADLEFETCQWIQELPWASIYLKKMVILDKPKIKLLYKSRT
jgi:hypothetical protein